VTWRWPPWRHVDTTDEARAALEQVQRRDAEITHLSKELQAVQRPDLFSIAVNTAIRRAREQQ